MLEFAEIRYESLRSYFSDVFNIFAFMQFPLYLNYFVLTFRKHTLDDSEKIDTYQALVEIILFFSIMTKVLEFLRTWRQYRFIIQMIMQVFIDIKPFLTLFFFFVLLFTMCMISLQGEVCKNEHCRDDDDEYPSVIKILPIFIQQFRNSIGDIAPPGYDNWNDNLKNKEDIGSSYIMIYMLWVIWLINIILMLIVMLNFLIAEVGNTYAKASMLGEKFHYRERAVLNFQKQKYLSYFTQRSRYNVIAFSTPREMFKDSISMSD